MEKDGIVKKAKGKAVRNIILAFLYNMVLFYVIGTAFWQNFPDVKMEQGIIYLLCSIALFFASLIFWIITFWEKMGNFYIILKEEKVGGSGFLNFASMVLWIPFFNILSIFFSFIFLISA